MSDREVILDTVVLSNFATTGSTDLLLAVLDQPTTVEAVREELEIGADEGYGHLSDALDRLGDEIPVLEITPDEPMASTLDSGEAAALTAAKARGAVFASDDLPAREIASELGVPRSGSLGILLRAVEQGRISEERADELLSRWRSENGYHSPVESISELRDGEA